ncbi:MAG: glycosyltransferase family 4 protein [bacterium]|nr:glycosyltransferase family 4 protein [bacterium]
MKVLYIVTAFPRYEGDVITPWLVESILKLKTCGLNIDVFTSSYKGLGNQRIYGIDVIRFRYFFKRWEKLTHEETTPDRLKRGMFYKILVIFYLIGGISGIIKLCRASKYDMIHVHWPLPHAIFGYIGKKLCNASIVSSFYGVELKWVKKKLPILTPFLKWAVKSSDTVTAISTYTANLINELIPTKVIIIPFGAAIASSQKIEDRGQRTEDRKQKPENNILFVGRLVERKGVKYLIEAFDMVSKKIDSTLTIVGEGSEREKLEKLVDEKGLKEKVIFTGKISEHKLKEYYLNCDVFVLPACTDSKGDTEGLGVVLIEAMSYKKPVVASQVGGIVDIVKDGETGLLVPEKDATKLAAAIYEVLNNKALANKFGEAGHKFIKTNFSWEKIIDRLVKTYNETS